MELAPLIRDLAVILAVAGLTALVFQRLRQPVVLGYLVAGMIVGPYTLSEPLVRDLPNIRTWAEIGVIFVMFSLGLEFSFRRLAHVGVSAALTACLEVLFMNAVGFTLGRIWGLKPLPSLFLGAMISISSTTIIVKALDEAGLKTRRFAQRILTILIVEDLIAITILVGLSTAAASRGFSGLDLLMSAGQLIAVVGSWFLAGYFLLPRFVRYVGNRGSNETLIILSLGLCLSLAVLAAKLHYSVALGAFIMGSILAESTESHRIGDLMEPVRDLFAALFFVSVGMLIDPRVLKSHTSTVALLTSLVLGGKMLSATLGSLVTGQTLRTSIQVGFGMAQIGEFSFIIAGLGVTLQIIPPEYYSVIAAISVITAFTTPYLIRYSHPFAVKLEKRLPFPIKNTLAKYAGWAQERALQGSRKAEFHGRAVRWLLNGFLVTVLFLMTRAVIDDRIWPSVFTPQGGWSRLPAWLIALALSLPFSWAMFNTFRGFRFRLGDSVPIGGTVIITRFLTLLWLGALTLQFFPPRQAFFVTGGSVALFFVLFFRQLESSYQWFENGFLAAFEELPKTPRQLDMTRRLAPWDAHLVRIKVHPNADVAGKPLQEVDFRANYGLNVVAIQRGVRTLIAPAPQERIFPKDELLVLGNDEQVDRVRTALERPPGIQERFRDFSEYELKYLKIARGSKLEHLRIRDSGIRSRFRAMVVGIERDEHRWVNPESDLVLQAGDILWIVGEARGLDSMIREYSII